MKIELPELNALFHDYCVSGAPEFKSVLSAACYHWWMHETPEEAFDATPVLLRDLESNQPHAVELYSVLVAARLAS